MIVSLTNNGNNDHTGKFFGNIEGDIMESMINETIFKELIIYDYQALCRYDEEGTGSSATTLLNVTPNYNHV